MSKIDSQFVDRILPFGAVFSNSGDTVFLGRSLSKILKGVTSNNFFDFFYIKSPRKLQKAESMESLCGKLLTLRFKHTQFSEEITVKGEVVKLCNDDDVYFLNISFGSELSYLIDILKLTDKDFSLTDPTADMLFLLKTQSSLLQDSQQLANRLSEAKSAAEDLAQRDDLTGLPNRRALSSFLNRVLSASPAISQSFTILHIDLDRFKQVNDTLGHAAGDTVLKHAAGILREHTRTQDLVARIGGDEFVMVLESNAAPDDIRSLGERIISLLTQPITIANSTVQIGASIGVTVVETGSEKSIDDILMEADLALYKVKDSGRGRVQFFDDALSQQHQRLQGLSRELAQAVRSEEFEPHFQLQFDTRSNRISGAEVLARWHHPQKGILTPGSFLFLADRNRLTEKIDTQIYRKALDLFAKWRELGIAPPSLSFNITAHKLRDRNFMRDICRLVDQHGIDRSEIIFELVESILIDGNNNEVQNAAQNLYDAGFRLSLDDFGTGRASIASLIAVPVGCVKIDRSFVSEIDNREKLHHLTRTIIGLCKHMEISIVAEGVERQEELEILVSMGCHKFQGYLFSRPVAAKAFESLLSSYSTGEANPAEALQQSA